MNKKIVIGSLVIILVLAIVFLIKNSQPDQINQPNKTAGTKEYINDRYGFALTLDKDFANSVEIKEEGRTVFFVSKEIQAKQPETIFGVVGRIEIFSKAEFSKETMMQAGDAYGLKYLGENEAYYFGWAHATDVQVPPGDETLGKEYRALEKKFDEAIKTFKTKETPTPEVKTDSGRYVGMADNNFFEVKISGVPEAMATKVFMISDKVRAQFDSLNLQTDEEIKIKYIQNEHGQNVVQDIEKI